MSLTYIPGYLGTVTLNSDILTTARVTSIELGKAAIPKPVFGAQYSSAISGVITGTFSAEGHVATVVPLADLITALESTVPVPFIIQLGEAAGATDGGTMAGDCMLTSLNISGDAEGEWDWTVSAATSGDVTHTAPTP